MGTDRCMCDVCPCMRFLSPSLFSLSHTLSRSLIRECLPSSASRHILPRMLSFGSTSSPKSVLGLWIKGSRLAKKKQGRQTPSLTGRQQFCKKKGSALLAHSFVPLNGILPFSSFPPLFYWCLGDKFKFRNAPGESLVPCCFFSSGSVNHVPQRYADQGLDRGIKN